MTYARARLFLGIIGVGSLVVIACLAIIFQLPHQFTSHRESVGISEATQIVAFAILYLVCLFPLDLLGGFVAPRKFGKLDESFSEWLIRYLPSAIGQAGVFVVFALLILFLSQTLGWLGGLLSILGAIVVCLQLRQWSVLRQKSNSPGVRKKVNEVVTVLQAWNLYVPRLIVAKHLDVGFTGGVIGFGHRVKIVIPEGWLSLPSEQLATAVARRILAIQSGSYSRGVLIAVAWNVTGFLLSSLIPGAGLTNVSGLITTIFAFTVWSFLGLLILPTLSRNASLQIDHSLTELGVAPDLVVATSSQLDQLQDDEPERPTAIETIFHPIPSVSQRNRSEPNKSPSAWNVARTTLFLSWACLGLLSRSVHCNVGRPELWTMLPSE